MDELLFITNAFPQPRVIKYLNYFKSRGYQCTVLTCRIDHKKVSTLNMDYKVIDIGVHNYMDFFPISIGKVRNVLGLLKDENIKPDIVFVRDIFQADLGYRVARHYNAKFFVDIADNYPEVFSTMYKYPIANKTLSFIFNKIEKRALERAVAIFAVTESSKKLLASKHEVSLGKINVIKNYPSKKIIRRPNINEKNNKMVYIGSFNAKIRDLETIGSYLLESDYHHLDIYTFDKDRVLRLLKDKFDNRIVKKVSILDPIPNNLLIQKISEYHIGLIPHFRSPGTDYTEPNKLYDYVHARLPILSSNNPSLESTVVSNEIGHIYEPKNVNSLSKAINFIEKNYSLIISNQNRLSSDFLWEEQFEKLDIFFEREK